MEARCPYKTNKEYGDGTDAAQAPCGLLGRVLEGRDSAPNLREAGRHVGQSVSPGADLQVGMSRQMGEGLNVSLGTSRSSREAHSGTNRRENCLHICNSTCNQQKVLSHRWSASHTWK
ncbi:hypothetical protein KUCAC02_007917, partial [Chaenocephalus aceratus]